VPGIVHEKSGSGQTFFVEPLAIVEANNALAEALEEEREEVRRILVALTSLFSGRRAELSGAAAILTELDVAQARTELSSRMAAVAPSFEDRLVLKAARHPLLDRRLATLRQEVFGEDAETRHSDAVPLDIELPEGKRTLLLSGPNAGGKSVAMKTVGLVALLAQSGFFVPAAPGSALPIFDDVLVVAGDAQDLLGDLSSFAASMVRTSRVLAKATGRTLVLLDELGSGTDPDEGASLAISVLEEDARRGGYTVATTHLTSVKEWAQAQPAVLSAAMEFDEKEGRPTFHVRPGATGRSRALAVAERSGLPRRVVESARARLGSAWAAHDAALERLEAESRAARDEKERASLAAARAEVQARELEKEKAQLQVERKRITEKLRAELDRALEAMREKTRRELDRLRQEAGAGKTIARGALTTITERAREEAAPFLADEPEESGGPPPAVGDSVRVAPFRATGRLVALDASRGEAEVEVSGKRMRVKAADVKRAAGAGPAPSNRTKPAAKQTPERPGAEPSPTSTQELVLIGLRVDAALTELESAIDDALLAGKGALRIVHGFGTGRLGAAVKEFLAEHPGVASYRPGDSREGGNAVTIAKLDT
jgi:DNA mismatch repair protein MutS2